MPLTLEQQALRKAAEEAIENDFAYGSSLTTQYLAFVDESTPHAVLALLAEIERLTTAAPFAYVTADRKMLIFADNTAGITDDISTLTPLFLGSPAVQVEQDRTPQQEDADDVAQMVAAEVLSHIDTMYPDMWKPVAKLARTSIRNTIRSQSARFLKLILANQREATPSAEPASQRDAWPYGFDKMHPTCNCATCNPHMVGRMMILCATCGNKRCPHAKDYNLTCTNSNEPGQPGSSYGPAIAAPVEQTSPKQDPKGQP